MAELYSAAFFVLRKERTILQSKFGTFHPAVIFLYFIVIIALSMFVMHPAFLIISLIAGFTYSIILKGRKALKFNACFILPMALVSILINILFNHNGQTVAAYLPWNAPVTYESIIAGFATAAMIAVVICWFSCYNVIMTNDKFIYIFGKRMPSLSLILSMVFRFVPGFKAQFKKTVTAQRCIGYDLSTGKLSQRIKNLAKVMSVMTAWALENSIETADSMKGRGYGLKGKTSFNIYRFQKKDMIALIFITLSFIYIFICILKGRAAYEFYPTVNIQMNSTDVFAVFFILCILPIFIEIQEIIKWKYFQSKI